MSEIGNLNDREKIFFQFCKLDSLVKVTFILPCRIAIMCSLTCGPMIKLYKMLLVSET